MRSRDVVTSVFLALGSAAVAGAAGVTYAVVESKSSVQIHVGKSGALSFAGHKHEVQAPVSGTVTADPKSLSGSSVDLTFASGRLRVLPEGEPSGDAPKVEAAMHGPEVLDAVRFPTIHFKSKKVTGQQASGGGYDLSLVGDLSLHGMTRELNVPVKVTLDGRTLTAVGRTAVRHDQFGMKPVTAGGGSVRVSNEIEIEFKIVAEEK